MDPIVTSILVQAVDFLFDEGRKILQWRREHLPAATNDAPSDASASGVNAQAGNIEPAEHQRVVSAKDELLRQRIDEAMLANKRGEIEHLVQLMEIHTRNFRTAEQQFAMWGMHWRRRSSSTT